MGPKICEFAFFSIKPTPYNFDFVKAIVRKFSNWFILGGLTDPPIFQNGPQYGGSNTYEGYFQIK